MKKIEKISEGTNYSAVTVGSWDTLGEHVFRMGQEVEIPGKAFAGSALAATGAEISFQQFEPGTGTPFLHRHRTHEELYLFVQGKGEFQVDGEVFPVEQGAVVRVSTEGVRSVRNNGDEPLIMICVQYKSGTFGAADAADGVILPDSVVW